MFRAAPLMDCTRDALHTMNQIHTLPHGGSAAKPVRTTRHNPYAMKMLAPEDSLEYHNSRLNSPLSARRSPLSWEARAFDPACLFSNVSTPYYAPPLTNLPADAQLHRSLFADSSAAIAGTSPSNASTELPVMPVAVALPKRLLATPPQTAMPSHVCVEGRSTAVARHGNAVTVQLRSGEANFAVSDIFALLAGDADTRDLVGLPVIVEGDRGEDFGVVTALVSAEAAAATAPSSSSDSSAKSDDGAAARDSPRRSPKPLLKVLRVATAQEVQGSEALPQREAEALEYCRACLQEVRLAVPITIESVVFQFDRKKLTVRYTSEAYVDFNDLTRMLHKKYNCRIWMDQLNRDAVAGAEKRTRRGEHGGRRSCQHRRGSAKRREH